MKYIPLKYIREDPSVGNADDSSDAKESAAKLERLVADLRGELEELSSGAAPLRRAEQAWEGAAQCCDVLFLADQPQSLAALGQGIWLAVTYPVDPELTVALLHRVVEETPPDADGAAVAAIAAYYVADLRAQEPQREHLLLYANQVLATVARRHSGVDGQEPFNRWIQDMELADPAKFLPRLRNVVDVLVQDDWWFDREKLQATLPAD
jgi:hypothetical protein